MAPLIHQRFQALAEDELKILRERAQTLAKPLASDDTRDRTELLELHSRGQRFVLPLSAVEGIIQLTSVAHIPRAPPFVRGLVSFRGAVLIGIELCTFAGGAQPGFADLQRIVAIAAGGYKLALLTEKIVSVRSASTSAFVPDPSSQQPFVVGTDEGFATLLDPALLIAQVFNTIGAGQ